MGSFEIDGAPLRGSILSRRSDRAAPCRLLLDIRPETLDKSLELLAQHGSHGDLYSGLSISGITDLEYLREYPGLLYLEIKDVPAKALQCIEAVSNLRGLRLQSPKCGIDFGCFPELEEFVGDWHRDNAGIALCRELRTLRTWGFRSEQQDLSDLAGCVRLERLGLVKPGITSLEGIEALEDLRYLTVAYAPKISDLAPLASSTVNLREIEFENLKNIADYAPLASIRKLRRLQVFKCAPMKDLEWTRGMEYLDFFSFVETNVLCGDLSPLLALPRLRYVGAGNRRDYSHSDNELNELLERNEE